VDDSSHPQAITGHPAQQSGAYPGGYAEAAVVPANALARIPAGFVAAGAAPMECASVTTFNSLRCSAGQPGDLVAILGLGGLGHLAGMDPVAH
jgi:alcohol dehydrogenase